LGGLIVAKRLGLARLEKLVESLKREIDFGISALKNSATNVWSGTNTFENPVNIQGVATLSGQARIGDGGLLLESQAVTVAANDTEIQPSQSLVIVDCAAGSSFTGIRLGGLDTGTILTIIKSGAGDLTFHNTEATSRVRGINAAADVMKPNGAYLFINDGTYWVFIGGGAATNANTLQGS
jgi:hypothetical protein